MKFRLLAISLIFTCVNTTDGMLPSVFSNAPQSVGQTIPQPKIRWRKVRRLLPNKRTYTNKQKIDLNPIKAPNLESQTIEPEEYFHKSLSQKRNNQDLINLNRSTSTLNFVQSSPTGRNPVPTELARQPKASEGLQFVQQKREVLQPQNTPLQVELSEELSNQNKLEEFFKSEIDKFFSFEGIALEDTKNQEEGCSSSTVKSGTQLTEETTPMEEDTVFFSKVSFRKKNLAEKILDPIFLKYEHDRKLDEFIDLFKKALPLNMFRHRDIYIKRAIEILEANDITGEYSGQFLKFFPNKKYSGRYERNNVNIFVRIVKNMRYQDLVRAYNLYPLIILEPVNGTDIVSALTHIKFSGKQSKMEFLGKYYKKAIENLNQGKLPEKSIE